MLTSLVLIFSLMLKVTLALRCYSCTDMKLPYGNDNWYVNPCMNGTEMCSPCKGNLGEFVDCENGTCMASVGEGGAMRLCWKSRTPDNCFADEWRETCFCNEDQCNTDDDEWWKNIWGRATGKGINYAVCTGAWLPKKPKEPKEPKKPKKDKEPGKTGKLKCFECLEAPKDSKRQETHLKFIKRGIKNPMPCFKNDDYREMRILDKERVKEGCNVCKLHNLDNGTVILRGCDTRIDTPREDVCSDEGRGIWKGTISCTCDSDFCNDASQLKFQSIPILLFFVLHYILK